MTVFYSEWELFTATLERYGLIKLWKTLLHGQGDCGAQVTCYASEQVGTLNRFPLTNYANTSSALAVAVYTAS